MLVRRCAVHCVLLDPSMRCPRGHDHRYVVARGVYVTVFELYDASRESVTAVVRNDEVEWLVDDAAPVSNVKLAGRDGMGIARDARGRVNRVVRGRGRRRSKDGNPEGLD